VLPPGAAPEVAYVWKTEEKGSDVNLGVHLVRDAFRGAFELAAVLTNDTDLVEPVRIVTKELNLPVTLLAPSEDPKCGQDQARAHQPTVLDGDPPGKHVRRACRSGFSDLFGTFRALREPGMRPHSPEMRAVTSCLPALAPTSPSRRGCIRRISYDLLF
jgi:hypothetical protein